jgi:lipoprotein NlpI
MTKSELNQIIVYYNTAIKHDPNDDDAYFHRGIANFYAGALPQALADLSQASRLDPEYAYYALWIGIVDRRGNAASRLAQAIAHVDMTKWPAPVIRMFLGQATPAAVLAAADDPDAKTKAGQVCEANSYSAELALQQGAKAEAERLFRLAAAGCPREFVEGPAANSELAALDGSH